MKYSFSLMTMIFLGMAGLVIIGMFESITLDNDSEYYTLKEAMEASMLESVDVACYRNSSVEYETNSNGDIVVKEENGQPIYKGCNGSLKISEQKFVENFTRRFAQSISGDVDSYTVDFYDIKESPPKATVVIKSHNSSYSLVMGDDDLNILNNLSGILEMID